MILKPIGIERADMSPVSEFDPRPLETKKSTQTLYYPYPIGKPVAVGKAGPDWTYTGGGGGWILSVCDLARFWAYLRYAKIFDLQTTNLIFNRSHPDDSLILSEKFFVEDGWALWRRGKAGDDNSGAFMSWVYDFAGGAQLSFVSNCNIPISAHSDLIDRAYKGGWK